VTDFRNTGILPALKNAAGTAALQTSVVTIIAIRSKNDFSHHLLKFAALS
jgi:hypothetical protein